MKKKSLTLPILVAILIIALSIYGSMKISKARADAQKAAAGPRDTAVVVKTGIVELGSVKNILTFNGDIEALRTVDLQAKVAGRLLTLQLPDGTPVEEGTRVLSGQQIAQLDNREFHAKLTSATAARAAAEASCASVEAALEQRKASLASSQVSLKDKQREYDRYTSMRGAATQQDIDQRETALNLAKTEELSAEALVSGGEAALQQAKASLQKALAEEESAQLNYDETTIYAPMNGVISKKHLDPGVQVTASTPLVTILEIDTVKVVISIPVNRLSMVIPGKTQALLRTAVHPKEKVPCVVEKIYPAVDTVTRTAQVELRLKNPVMPDGTYQFLPGMYATVELLLEERNDIVTVDVSLPIRNLDKQLVFVCEGDTVRAVPVTLGLTTGGMVEVLEGLNPGDEVVVQGQHRLTDGATIKRIEE